MHLWIWQKLIWNCWFQSSLQEEGSLHLQTKWHDAYKKLQLCQLLERQASHTIDIRASCFRNTKRRRIRNERIPALLKHFSIWVENKFETEIIICLIFHFPCRLNFIFKVFLLYLIPLLNLLAGKIYPIVLLSSLVHWEYF